MGSRYRLGLFGVIHMDRPTKVANELETFAEGVDAIFLETDSLSMREYIEFLVRTPLYQFGAFSLFLAVQAPLLLLFNRDIQTAEAIAVRRVAGDYLPVYAVDEHPLRRSENPGVTTVVANWLGLVAAVWVAPAASVSTLAVVLGTVSVSIAVRREGYRKTAVAAMLSGYVALAWLLVANLLASILVGLSAVGFFAVVYRTIGRRNRVMLDRVADRSERHGYGRVVLVTGNGHLGGLVRLAKARDISVPAVHVSAWVRRGEMHLECAPEELPEIGRSRIESRTHPGVIPGTERSAIRGRIGAALVDTLIVLPMLALVDAVLVVGIFQFIAGPGANLGLLPTYLVAVVLTQVSYHAILEFRYGTTVGKHVAGVAVATVGGDRPSVGQVLVRNLLRPVDALGLYLLGVVSVAFTTRNQRLGDLAAGTVVGQRADPDNALERAPSSGAEPDRRESVERLARSEQPPESDRVAESD